MRGISEAFEIRAMEEEILVGGNYDEEGIS